MKMEINDDKIILLIVMDCDGSFVPEREMSKVKLYVTESIGASTYKATLVRPPSEQKRSTFSLRIYNDNYYQYFNIECIITLQGVWKGLSLHPFTVVDSTSRTISPLSSKENTISGSPLVHDLALISATAFYRHNYM